MYLGGLPSPPGGRYPLTAEPSEGRYPLEADPSLEADFPGYRPSEGQPSSLPGHQDADPAGGRPPTP